MGKGLPGSLLGALHKRRPWTGHGEGAPRKPTRGWSEALTFFWARQWRDLGAERDIPPEGPEVSFRIVEAFHLRVEVPFPPNAIEHKQDTLRGRVIPYWGSCTKFHFRFSSLA